MKPSSDLHELIHALTKSEKRHYKMYSSIYSGKKTYFKLFDAISRQKNYDEGAILNEFKTSSFTKQLPVAKNQLYRQILSALETYHRSIHSEIKRQLHWVEILYQKGLLKQSNRIIKKIKKTAGEHEMHHVMFELFRLWEMNIAVKNADAHGFREILEEEKKELSLFQNSRQYRDIYFRLAAYHYLYGLTRDTKHLKKIKHLITGKYFNDEHRAITFEAKLRYYDSRNFYFSTIGDHRNSYLSTKKIIELYKNNPEKIQFSVSAFMTHLNNLIQACQLNQKYIEIPLLIDEYKLLESEVKTPEEKTKLFFLASVNNMGFYIITGQFQTALSDIAGLMARLSSEEPAMNDLEKALIYQHIALIYFGAREYKASIHWLNRIRNEVSLGIRPDFDCSLRLLYLIVQYEAGNMDLIPSLILSVYRFLRKKEQLYKFESYIIHFLKNEIPKAKDNKELLSAFRQFKEKIRPLTQDNYEKAPFEFFDYVSWLESKIENKTFAEVIRQKAGLHTRA